MTPQIVARLALCTWLLALAQPAAAETVSDPLEAMNRRIHAFNQGARRHVLGPLAELYSRNIPDRVHKALANALTNLSEPITAISGLAAGDLELASNAAARFGINSTLGLGGVEDRAAHMGYAHRSLRPADAVCRWGVPSGPFLVLPLLGPSTLRDAGAMVATSAALSQAIGPDVFAAWSGTDLFIAYAQAHPELERVEAQSLDPYAVYRSAYLQSRAAVCPADQDGRRADE